MIKNVLDLFFGIFHQEAFLCLQVDFSKSKSIQSIFEDIKITVSLQYGVAKTTNRREHGLQTYWFLKPIALLTATGEIYPRKLSAYGLNKDRSGKDFDLGSRSVASHPHHPPPNTANTVCHCLWNRLVFICIFWHGNVRVAVNNSAHPRRNGFSCHMGREIF